MIRREHPRREPQRREGASASEQVPAGEDVSAREQDSLRGELAQMTAEPQQPVPAAARVEAPSVQPAARTAAAPDAITAPKPEAPRPEATRPEAPESVPPGPSVPRPSTARPAPPRPPAGSGELAAPRSGGGLRRPLSDAALRGYRDVVPDGRAPAQARRGEGYDSGASRPILPPAPTFPAPRSAGLEPQLEPQLGPQAPPEELWAPSLDDRLPRAPVDLDRAGAHMARPSLSVTEEPEAPVARPPRQLRSYSGLIRLLLALVLLGAAAGAAYWQRDALGNFAAGIAAWVRPSQPAREAATAPPTRPKITDRIEQPTQQPSVGLPVAQRVALYEEDPNNAQGKSYTGTVLWRTEMKPSAPGRPPEIAVRADIEVPERKLAMTWTLRRNTDPSLPASHTIEIMFHLPENTPVGGVQNVPGVLMKQSEQTRGVPLAGLAVKVTPGYFLIGLSSIEADKQRNIQLLKERPWFDIPIVYNNNRRAILAMEKGTPGERAFAAALAAWKE
jgi:hypothetical protein